MWKGGGGSAAVSWRLSPLEQRGMQLPTAQQRKRGEEGFVWVREVGVE